MKSLLCYVLSFSIIFSSASPAMAQVAQAGRASRALTQTTRATEAAAHIPTLIRQTTPAVTNTARATAQLKALQNQTARTISQIQRTLPATIEQQRWLQHSSVTSLATDGALSTAATKIFEVPTLAQREPLLRNDFVLLSLINQVSAEQIQKAHQFYKADLQKNLSSFAKFTNKNLLEVLTQPQNAEALSACRDALSSAAALALTGTAADAESLIALHRATLHTPFEEVATRLTARGLLRLQAYEAFQKWAEPLSQEGDFWSGLTVYARREHLPVSTHATVQVGRNTTDPILLKWLEEGNLANGLNASDSLEATEKWMNLGRVEKKGPASASNVAPLEAPTLVLPESLSAEANLRLAPTALQTENLTAEVASETAPAAVTPAMQTPAPATASAQSGILYGGLPIFSLLNTAQKTWNWFKGLLGKKQSGALKKRAEEPGLHENTVRAIYEEASAPVTGPGDVWQEPIKEVGETGFKMTWVENAEGEESILHNVNITISASVPVQTEGYNRLAFRQDGVWELRNLTQPAGKIDHFFVKLANNKAFYDLALGAGEIDLHRALRVKIEGKPNRSYSPVDLRVVDFETGRSLNVIADVDPVLLPKNASGGTLFLKRDGNIYFGKTKGDLTLLKGFYIRLPKTEGRQWMKIIKNNPEKQFNLVLEPTVNKQNFLTRIVGMVSLSGGKTWGAFLESLGVPGGLAYALPLWLNNSLSILLGPLKPWLVKIGDANVLRLAMGCYTLCAVSALGTGLTGFIPSGDHSLQIKGILTSLLSMGIGAALTNYSKQNLVHNNTGEIPAKKVRKSRVNTDNVTPNLTYLGQRFKQVITEKGSQDMIDSVRYQWLSVFKNLGTFAFLSIPFLFNQVSKLVGSSVRADFSLSFWPLGALSAYALYKAFRLPLKDSVSRNFTVLKNTVLDKEYEVLPKLVQWVKSPQGQDLRAIAKELSGVISPYAQVQSYKTGKKQKEIAQDLENETLQRLQQALTTQGLAPAQVNQVVEGLQKEFNNLDRGNQSLWKAFLSKGVRPGLAAMSLLTIHELGTASEFAHQIKDLVKFQLGTNAGDSLALGMFLTGVVLYGTTFLSRIAGNWIALRTSEGSMYTLSSSASLIGTTMMILSGNSLGMFLTGGVLASFGMGNFFAQVFEHIVKDKKQIRQALSVLIGLTMPVAALATSGVHSLQLWGVEHGIGGLGLMAAEAALIASFFADRSIFANGSLYKSIKYYASKIKNLFKRNKNNPPSADMTDLTEAPAQ